MTIGQTMGGRHALAVELADRCVGLLSPHDWDHVHVALGEMHDQLVEDIPDQEEFNEVFGSFVASLVERLGCPAVASWEQARIYVASGNRDHRDLGDAWIKLRRQ
jgi:hypothetical protein